MNTHPHHPPIPFLECLPLVMATRNERAASHWSIAQRSASQDTGIGESRPKARWRQSKSGTMTVTMVNMVTMGEVVTMVMAVAMVTKWSCGC